MTKFLAITFVGLILTALACEVLNGISALAERQHLIHIGVRG